MTANLRLQTGEQSAAALGDSEARLNFALTAAGVGYWERDLARNTIVASDIDKANWGLAATEEMSLDVLTRCMHPDDRQRHRDAIAHALATGEPMEIEYRVLRPDGELRWLRVTSQTIFAEDGTPLRMAGTSLDITARKQIEESLREETRTLEILNRTGAALAGNLDLQRIMQTVTDAATELSNAQFGAFFYNVADQPGSSSMLCATSGVSREALTAVPLRHDGVAFDPASRRVDRVRAGDVRADPRFEAISPFRALGGERDRVVSYLSVPVVSRSGQVMGGLYFGHERANVFSARSERMVAALASQAAIALDNAKLFASAERELAERRRIEKHQDLLLAELNHRVKNTLAIVLSIATQTLRHSDTAEAFRAGFEARIMALAEAHNLLTEGNWEGASFRDIVQRVLEPFHGDDAPRYLIEADQDVRVGPRTAVAMVMALHELATNAAKHGALSSPTGLVSVSWSVAGPEQRLRVIWRESGGPPVKPPQRPGFGSRLIKGLSEDTFGGVELEFAPSGVICTFELPLTPGSKQ